MTTMNVESLIKLAADYLSNGYSLDDIHASLVSIGCTEDDCFLIIKAGQLLGNDREVHIEELLNRKPPFGRK